MSKQTTNNLSLRSVSSQSTSTYSFPHHRLKRMQTVAARKPLVLVACGSFSPITYLHARIFEMAADYTKFNDEFEVMGGYLSPVSDVRTLREHRLRMCELAIETSQWVMVDPWEAEKQNYVPTAQVLDHFEHELNEVLGGAQRADGSRVPYRIFLLAGADLVQTMSTPIWSEKDLDHILGQFGVFVVERTGTNIDDVVANLQQRYKDNIHIIHQFIQNDVSSTKIRLFLKKQMSVRYLIPTPVIEYIEENGLYRGDSA